MPNPKPHAIVIGLGSMTGLQTARILKARGVPVVALTKNRSHSCCRTRVCEAIHETDLAGEGLIRTLERLGPGFSSKPVLFPCSDMSVLNISRHRDRLRDHYRFGLPDHDVVEMLMDKTRFYAYAAEHDLPIPGTFFLASAADAREAAGKLTYPCILKPPIKTPGWEKHTKLKVFKVASPDELLALYERCSSWAPRLMVQEWIEGTDANLYSCNCYFDAESEPQVTFIARKLRQWPPETGTSCLGEECRNDDVLRDSIRLFRSVGYHGLGYVEMKRDERTGKHYIIEPNIGRPTGRSAIAEAGGVELLYTQYCDLVGLPLPADRLQQYRGVKWIYLRHDAQSAFHYWRRGELTLSEWWRSLRGPKGYALFSWTDWGPFLHDWWKAVGTLLGSRKSGAERAAESGAERTAEPGAEPAAEPEGARTRSTP